eukprot:TRINITY_DN9394_c0_g1_i9.p1 TRINITY_DN9394_c0_g1~~TRINITY_DN9394_c0_g1_i9.p1  ORF type:complete len:220 (+),score=81.08 TRINITY_DN9394_c0_g1_i9:67-660(+)
MCIRDRHNYDREISVPSFTNAVDFEDKVRNEGDVNVPNAFEEESEEEKEDFKIKKSDAIILASKIENEFSSLEVYIFEEETSNLYVHHDILLSAFPLCLEWLPVDPASFGEDHLNKGNFVLVGSFLPEIEIWDIDVVDAIEPFHCLGGEAESGFQESKKKKVKNFKGKKNFKPGSHTDAVLSINLNTFRKYATFYLF